MRKSSKYWSFGNTRFDDSEVYLLIKLLYYMNGDLLGGGGRGGNIG